MSKYIENTVYQFGQVGPAEKVKFEFPFNGNRNDIYGVDNGCPCTDAWYENGKVVGVLDIAKAGSFSDKGEPSPVTKYVHVYLNDGKDMYVVDDKLRLRRDYDKARIRLMITGVVSG